ncbi:DUF882 domain-containing protein [Nitratireductor sp. GZWM139]|uniref:DUF882 domain-containing protein n=1 Tax=Nitratireductor sp. GZWM139 TaxID=2950541 RepID=UPI0024BE1171|nr:DUF882 domain-containing protein [Nitratireductor sp. GZWM139]MDJ1462918.1 DUF882 domain-containing protein [Nitratireductor sp. GZWM139]
MLAASALLAAAPAAHAETRTLKLYFIHTKERAEITYKRNGRYIQSGLKQVNRFLRDWRRNEPTNMDPQVLDLLWETYRAAGARDYIHVVSAYRSPQTNAMLRSRSSGVAKKSQHMLGKAIDFYIPGVKLSTLRNSALKFQAGGVGYYPRSGSPFIHIDVGGVRHWPRMSRKELLAVFPSGNTIHVPTDGKPLPGYKQALASYEARKRKGSTIQVARDTGSKSNSGGGRGLLATLFGGGADEEEDNAETTTVAARQPAARRAPAPEAAPEPQPETPGTILAALPQRSVPTPRAAPRPAAEVGQQPLPFEVKPVEEAPTIEEATPQDAGTAVLVAANIPTPTQRPEYAPETSTQEALAQIAAAEPQASDAIAGVLADAAQEEEPITTAAYMPLPSSRPAQALAPSDEFTLAAQPQPRPQPAAVTAPESDFALKVDEQAAVTVAAAPAQPERGQPVSASPRQALLARADQQAAPRPEIRSRSTRKSAKPGPNDIAPGAQPVVVAATGEAPIRALSRNSMLNEAVKPTQPPAFDSEFVRSPETVYTTGFQQDVTVADATRFTGKAVNFISMARFRTN